jgi:hypothetical protein
MPGQDAMRVVQAAIEAWKRSDEAWKRSVASQPIRHWAESLTPDMVTFGTADLVSDDTVEVGVTLSHTRPDPLAGVLELKVEDGNITRMGLIPK